MDKNNRPLPGALSAGESEESEADLGDAELTPESGEVEAQDLALSPVDAESTDLTVTEAAVASGAVTRSAAGLTVPAWANANPITRYFYECYIELRKTTWPANNEAWTMTWIVIGMSIGVAILLGAADYGFNYVVNWVLTLSGK
jgi:preprotein translocase SecE subunit